MPERYITLAIHTYPHALTLKRILGSHGVVVKFENIVINGCGINSGVRVKIREKDLPLALKITESGDSFPAAKMEMKLTEENASVLIPVDFSQNSLLACRAGFEIAARLDLHPVLLHAYISPYFSGYMANEDLGDGSISSVNGSDMADMQEEIDLQKESEKMMATFRRRLDSYLSDHNFPAVNYSTIINEGIPEEVILEYCRLTPPALVVMATRGIHKKGEQLIGSVTAEVLDSCRIPVFTIPENFGFTSIESLKKLVYFCNLDQQDLLSVDTLMRTFSYPEVDVTVIPVNERAGNDVREKVDFLCNYFKKNYPTAEFTPQVFPAGNFREDFEKFQRQAGIQLLIVPNKKKNVFSRLFNPGIAHKLLFENDIPLLALPV